MTNKDTTEFPCFEKEIPQGYEARIEGNKVIFVPKESEDEKTRKSIIGLVQHGGYMSPSYKTKAIDWLEKHKEQQSTKSTTLLKAFINSKIDYTLEEKCDASDYADAVLPTSVAMGENDEEYNLHKIIEAAFIAGQKKEQQKPTEWSERDEEMVRFYEASYNNQIGNMSMKDVIDMKIKFKDWLVNRVKFLRPQPHWKPSKEQINALKVVVRGYPAEDLDAIESLLNDLQKLI